MFCVAYFVLQGVGTSVELAAPGVDVLSSVPYLPTADLTMDCGTYAGKLMEYVVCPALRI